MELFLSKMRRYGIRSAILTIVDYRGYNLITKEAVIQRHLEASVYQLKKHNGKNVIVQRILSEDLELFYTSLQNPESQPKKDFSLIFWTKNSLKKN